MICNICKDAFKSFWWDEHGLMLRNIHHRTLEGLDHSAQVGCRICSILKERWEAIARSYTSLSLEDGALVSCFLFKLPVRKPNIESEELHVGFYLNLTDVDLEIPEEERSASFVLVQLEELNAGFDDSYQIENSTNSPSAFDLTGRWLRTCLECHENCKPEDQLNWMPNRLLDVGSDGQGERIYLSHRPGEAKISHPYATLSHCWGNQTINSLQKHNLEALTNAITLMELPKTFRDAVNLVRYLGIRYIWIDALCIVQDSEEDWRRESLLMDKVYRYSTLNIAASDAEDSDGGCFFSRDPNLRPEIVSVKARPEGDLMPYYLVQQTSGVLELFEYGPLYRRAWVLQERMLPPRLLHCGKTQLTWQCRKTIASEAYPNGRREDDTSHYRQLLRRLISRPRSAGHLANAYGFKDKTAMEGFIQRFWQGMVEIYSSCSLTNPEDKLIAIAGLVLGMQPILGEYLAGLWKSNLARELLWVTVPSRIGSPPPHRSPAYRAPSWSWASIDGAVDYSYPGRIAEEPIFSIEKVEIVGSVGEVSSGFLRIRGKLCAARIIRQEAPPQNSGSHQYDEDSKAICLIASPYRDPIFLDDESDLSHPPQDAHILPLFRRAPLDGQVESDYICFILQKSQVSEFCRIGLCKLQLSRERFESWADYVVEIH